MSDEKRPTDRVPFSPEEAMQRDIKTRRAMATTTDAKLELILDLLEEGDAHFERLDKQREADNRRYEQNDAINLRFMHSINVRMKDNDQAAHVELEIGRRYPTNGSHHHEDPTNPTNERPEADG